MKRSMRLLLSVAFVSLFVFASVPADSLAGSDDAKETSFTARTLETVYQNYLASLRAEALESNGTLQAKYTAEGPASSWLTRVNADEVNMVTNRHEEGKQLGVSIEGKTYHVANETYAMNLKNNLSSRFTTDPVSGKRIDKSEAVTYADASERVFYFESKGSFDAFIALAENEKVVYGYLAQK